MLLLHILQRKSYVHTCTQPVIRKFYLLKNILAYVGIHQLLHSSFCFLNTNTAITRQLIRTARTLEAEWWQVLQGSMGTRMKEDESSTERIWAAGFHHVTACSRLARIFKLTNRLFL